MISHVFRRVFVAITVTVASYKYISEKLSQNTLFHQEVKYMYNILSSFSCHNGTYTNTRVYLNPLRIHFW